MKQSLNLKKTKLKREKLITAPCKLGYNETRGDLDGCTIGGTISSMYNKHKLMFEDVRFVCMLVGLKFRFLNTVKCP